jgi:hypothetical protein
VRRLSMCLAWLAVASALAGAFPAAAAPAHRIVAVGDLHGDFSAWRDIARAARLVDEGGAWIGGDTILVQTGDVVDRGPDSLKILLDLMRLQGEAPATHGQVVALVGNHEAMNVTGDLRYVSPADYAAFADRNSLRRRDTVYAANVPVIEAAYRKRDPQMSSGAIRQAWLDATPLGLLEHHAAWRADGRIGRWVVGNPAVALIDGNIFVHGGISPAYARRPIADINRETAAALLARTTDPAAIINDGMGPLWYRGLATLGGEGAEMPRPANTAIAVLPPVQEQLDHLLSAAGAKRIVIGHTPILSGIAVSYEGRLIRIDTGISAVYGGTLSYLDIVDGIPVPHIVERSPISK